MAVVYRGPSQFPSIRYSVCVLFSPPCFFRFLFYLLFLTLLGLRCFSRTLSRCSVGFSLLSTGSRAGALVVVVHGLSCSKACGIFLDQGLNPCLCHWQADFLPLNHQGSPRLSSFKDCFDYLGRGWAWGFP